MKKLLLTAVVALGTLTAMQAQDTEVQNPTTVQEETVKEEPVQEDSKMLAKADVEPVTFKEINVTELPAAVSKALAKDFKDATVEKAFVNDKAEYKLVLQTAATDIKISTKTVFATKDGTWIKKPKAMLKQ